MYCVILSSVCVRALQALTVLADHLRSLASILALILSPNNAANLSASIAGGIWSPSPAVEGAGSVLGGSVSVRLLNDAEFAHLLGQTTVVIASGNERRAEIKSADPTDPDRSAGSGSVSTQGLLGLLQRLGLDIDVELPASPSPRDAEAPRLRLTADPADPLPQNRALSLLARSIN